MLSKHSFLQYLILTRVLAAPPIPSNTNSFVYTDYNNIYLYRLQTQVFKLENNFTYVFTEYTIHTYKNEDIHLILCCIQPSDNPRKTNGRAPGLWTDIMWLE